MPNTNRNSGVHSKLRACYKKRKDCIKKKTSELATLCGVKACVVCIGPDRDIESWPENPKDVKSVIDLYNDYLMNGLKNEKKKQRVSGFDDENQKKKKEGFSDLSSVLDEKLKKVEERIEFLRFMNNVQNYFHIEREDSGIVSFDMDGDTNEQNMVCKELENKSTSVGFSGECCSTIVSEGSCGGSACSPCYTDHQIDIDTYYGGWNNVFEWEEGNFDELLEPTW